MTVGRFIRSFRLEAFLAGVAYVGLLVFAHPDAAAARLGLPVWPWTNRLFDAGLVLAMGALACLALRLLGRLLATGRPIPAPAGGRATSGTVMVEFALVFPVVLLVMCMIIQLALIANASLVVRYAAFAAARSAIVSFESETAGNPVQVLLTSVQFPPFPEWVDKRRPERAARLALASISPQTSAAGDSAARSMERLLQAQGGAWRSRHYASRFPYAAAATRVTTIRDRAPNDFVAWHESFSPLLPRSEHLIPPYAMSQGSNQFFIPVPPVPTVPGAVQIPLPPLIVQIGPISIPIPLPITHISIPLPNAIVDPINNGILAGFNAIRSGANRVLDVFTASPLNIDFFSPKEVEIEVEYDFQVTLPGLNFIPGMTKRAPIVGGPAFTIRHAVRLQSTGGRKANVIATMPWPEPVRNRVPPFRENWPLYWVHPW